MLLTCKVPPIYGGEKTKKKTARLLRKFIFPPVILRPNYVRKLEITCLVVLRIPYVRLRNSCITSCVVPDVGAYNKLGYVRVVNTYVISYVISLRKFLHIFPKNLRGPGFVVVARHVYRRQPPAGFRLRDPDHSGICAIDGPN